MTAVNDLNRDDTALLEQQLRDALHDASETRSPAFEVALLAGLRERLPGPAPILAEVDSWLERGGAEQLAAELPSILIGTRADPLLHPTDEEPDDERIDALLAFDELCAAFTFCGVAQRCDATAQLVSRAIRARPEAWAALSDFAARVLQHAPPTAEDPAGRVWRAVEAAQALTVVPDRGLAAPSQLLRLDREPMRLAASTGAPRMQTCALGQHARLTFIESHEGTELLIEVDRTEATMSAEYEGQAVVLTAVRPGTWACPVKAGLYVFTINGQTYPLEVG